LTQMNAEMEIMRTQTAVNATEAASSSLFVAGWRPGDWLDLRRIARLSIRALSNLAVEWYASAELCTPTTGSV
jgi:hypothetical protein